MSTTNGVTQAQRAAEISWVHPPKDDLRTREAIYKAVQKKNNHWCAPIFLVEAIFHSVIYLVTDLFHTVIEVVSHIAVLNIKEAFARLGQGVEDTLKRVAFIVYTVASLTIFGLFPWIIVDSLPHDPPQTPARCEAAIANAKAEAEERYRVRLEGILEADLPALLRILVEQQQSALPAITGAIQQGLASAGRVEALAQAVRDRHREAAELRAILAQFAAAGAPTSGPPQIAPGGELEGASRRLIEKIAALELRIEQALIKAVANRADIGRFYEYFRDLQPHTIVDDRAAILEYIKNIFNRVQAMQAHLEGRQGQ